MDKRIYSWIEPDHDYARLDNIPATLFEQVIFVEGSIGEYIRGFEALFVFAGKHPRWDSITLKKSKLAEIKIWLGKDADQYTMFILYLMALVQEQCLFFRNNDKVSQLRVSGIFKDFHKEAANLIKIIEMIYGQAEKVFLFHSLTVKPTEGSGIKISNPLLIKDMLQAYIRDLDILKNDYELIDGWKEVVQDYFTGNSIDISRIPMQFTKEFCKLLSGFFMQEKILTEETEGHHHIQGVFRFLELAAFYLPTAGFNLDPINVRNWIIR